MMRWLESAEWLEKRRRIDGFLDARNLDGLLLWSRANFSWLTGGKDSHLMIASPVGAAGMFVGRDRVVCIANEIEASRVRNEELGVSGIEVVSFPWFDPEAGRSAARELFNPERVACDSDELQLGLRTLPADIAVLRRPLVPDEIPRFREGARRASSAIEAVCQKIVPGMSEHEIAALLDLHVRQQGCKAVVNLIACDERCFSYRHPIPTDWKLRRYVMVVLCSEFRGLVSNLTRFVHFGKLTDELRAKQQSIANIDAAANLCSQPGRTLGEVFADIQAAYTREGFDGQWQRLHQGGLAGYAPREVVASPTSDTRLLSNCAVAWNPSIAGIKSEDTVLVTESGHEVLTAHSPTFPTVVGQSPHGNLPRAAILIRQ